MGTARNVKCPTCNNQWKYYEGFGFSQLYYYCDKCGKKQTVKYPDNDGWVVDLSSEYGQCKCGGTFRMNSDKIICPKCYSEIAD